MHFTGQDGCFQEPSAYAWALGNQTEGAGILKAGFHNGGFQREDFSLDEKRYGKQGETKRYCFADESFLQGM